jgi:hypothetical protein
VRKVDVYDAEYTAHRCIYAADPTLAPEIVGYLSSEKILTTALINGMSLENAMDVLDADERDELFSNVIRRIKYLHEKTGFSHRDCHAFNIFVNYNTELVCFIDFEFSKKINKISSGTNAELRDQIEYLIDLMELQLWYVDNLRSTIRPLTLEIKSLYDEILQTVAHSGKPRTHIETELIKQMDYTRGRVANMVRIINIQHMVEIFYGSDDIVTNVKCSEAVDELGKIMKENLYRASFQKLSKATPKLGLDSNYHIKMSFAKM